MLSESLVPIRYGKENQASKYYIFFKNIPEISGVIVCMEIPNIQNMVHADLTMKNKKISYYLMQLTH